MDDEWGPWIEHDGKASLPPDGTFIHVVFEDGDEWMVFSGESGYSPTKFGDETDETDHSWFWVEGYCRIIRYRIRRPKSMQILTNILREVEREREVV